MQFEHFKLEIFIPETHLEILQKALMETKSAIKKVHPYEEPVINVIPLYETGL